MYIYKSKVEGNPTLEFEGRYDFIPMADVTILANTFEEALKKVKSYRNEDIKKVAEIISIRRGNKVDMFRK